MFSGVGFYSSPLPPSPLPPLPPLSSPFLSSWKTMQEGQDDNNLSMFIFSMLAKFPLQICHALASRSVDVNHTVMGSTQQACICLNTKPRSLLVPFDVNGHQGKAMYSSWLSTLPASHINPQLANNTHIHPPTHCLEHIKWLLQTKQTILRT